MLNSKKIRLVINGFGRIGRAAFKIALERKNIEVVALNDLTDAKTLALLLRRDTVYGLYQKDVKASKDGLDVDGKFYPVFSEKDPALLPWSKLKVDVVIESTGFFTNQKGAAKHLQAGAKKVVISAPGKDETTPTYVKGVNTGGRIKADIISNASCTTNCIAPVIDIINEEIGVQKAMMTTIHSYTADQNLVDGPHHDLRRARAAAANIVPTTTGAAIATTKTIPELEGKFNGIAIRVPTIIGSLSDFAIVTAANTSVEEVNKIFKKAALSPRYKGILAVTEEPLVSSDIIGNSHSSIVDLNFTQVVGGNLLKILAWYDNEWGYASRLVDIVEDFA